MQGDETKQVQGETMTQAPVSSIPVKTSSLSLSQKLKVSLCETTNSRELFTCLSHGVIIHTSENKDVIGRGEYLSYSPKDEIHPDIVRPLS